MDEVSIDVQPTPNPNSMKFTLSVKVIESGSKTYNDAEAAGDSPLAQALLGLDGVASVFMLNNFITVSKRPDADWTEIGPTVAQTISRHFNG
ncbi:MAG TPA: NifU N-terminal domain-containing protein [Limnochordia bacterium]|nr:NifU N-terminal domain-containing protein [Limnochordia bacterium]